ncbi:MAG: hypothetical protein CMP07_09335 [Xanthomonadales bacterium]|nr:hypothetical protein [Xanthomonadales bacterium]|tara:strand:+ start:164 stop:301 length:138 start_codon:yes stop_codon:yes gene_type:complete
MGSVPRRRWGGVSGLCDQIQRSTVSVMANIAEGEALDLASDAPET